MRIIVHAGLPKTGTTSLQRDWSSWFGAMGEIWYPEPADGKNGHHQLLGPLVRGHGASAEARIRAQRDLPKVVELARASGVRTLLLSDEYLSAFTQGDAVAIEAALDGQPDVLLVTLTQPRLRAASNWQQTIRGGYPAKVPRESRLGYSPDRIAQLLSHFPARHRTIRLVRNKPPEEDLAKSLAVALGIEASICGEPGAPLNVGQGTAGELLRRLNSLGVTKGLGDPVSRSRYEEMRRHWRPEPASEPNVDFELPTYLSDESRQEREWLEDLSVKPDVTMLDPHDLLAEWDRIEEPAWLSQLREASWHPALSSESLRSDFSHILDEVVQLRLSLEESDARHLELTSALTTQTRRSDSLEKQRSDAVRILMDTKQQKDALVEQLAAITGSRSWRFTTAIRKILGRP